MSDPQSFDVTLFSDDTPALVPEVIPGANADYDTLVTARDFLEHHYVSKQQHLHTVYIGEIERKGVPLTRADGTPVVGLVVVTENKLPTAQLDRSEELPKAISLKDGTSIPIDVQVAPQPRDRRLYLDPQHYYAHTRTHRPYFEAFRAVNDWRKCHNVPLPGGVQIAPQRAGHVGTLSCALIFTDPETGREEIGAMTNYHVGVLSDRPGGGLGVAICQPDGRSGVVGVVQAIHPIQFSQQANNRVDACFLRTFAKGRPYPDKGVHTVRNEQFEIGKFSPKHVPLAEQKVGDLVVKSGRTTGLTPGRVVGIGASSYVDYGDEGVARFTDQIVLKNPSGGDMSAPGDSGSLILTRDGLRPYALLFAGGGGTTLANPIEFVLAAGKARFF